MKIWINVILFSFCLLSSTSPLLAESKNDEPIYKGEKLISEIYQFISKAGKNLITIDDLHNFAEEISQKETNLNDAFQWPGREYAFAIKDVNNDNIDDLIVGHFETTTTGAIYIFDQILDKHPEVYSFQYNEGYLVRGAALTIGDLNGDGILDVILQQNTGAQRYQTFDCIFMRRNAKKSIFYNECFYQEAGVLYENIRDFLNHHKNRIEVSDSNSNFVDFNNDKKYEIVVTKEFCFLPPDTCDRANTIVWPELYLWNGNKYELSKPKNNELYIEYKNILKKAKYPSPSIKAALNKLNALISQ